MRRFEHQQGTSHTYWEVEVAGEELVLHWGRLGAKGRSKTRRFGSPAEAAAEQQRLISEKTGEGFLEVAAPSPAEPAPAPRPPAPKAAPQQATRTLLRDGRGNDFLVTLQFSKSSFFHSSG